MLSFGKEGDGMNKKISLIFIGIFSVFVCIMIVLKQKTPATLKLLGKEVVKLEVGSEYVEYGFTAFIGDEDISQYIEVESDLDINKLGKYAVKYIIRNKDGYNNKKITRKIEVIDNKKPEIKLIGGNDISIYLNHDYQEMGFKAIDNYDGDISEKVIVSGEVNTLKKGKYFLEYKVSDSSNNSMTVRRVVNVVDKPSDPIKYGIPVLMYHFFYDKNKNEVGYDNNFVEISIFEQQMKYLVDEDYYFPSFAELEAFVDGNLTLPSKSIILTFDDGSSSFFKLAVPILEKYNIEATAFVISSITDYNYIKPYISDNLSFESHSYDMHRQDMFDGTRCQTGGIMTCVDYETGMEDLRKAQDETGGATIYCHPFGNYNDHSINMLKDSGFKLAFTSQNGKVKPGMNKYALPRVRISKDMTLQSFIDAIR